MTRIVLHIGPEQVGAERLQQVLADKRKTLAGKGILFPRSPGTRNHTRLFMAVSDPGHVDPLRFNRGFIAPDAQQKLYESLAADLRREIAEAGPDLVILSASQLGTSLHRASERDRLKAFLAPLAGDIRVLAHVDEPARLLARHYGAQVMEGRGAPLSRELALANAENWWRACLDAMPAIDPAAGVFEETQGPPFWLDFAELVRFWEGGFGKGAVTLRRYEPAVFAGEGVTGEIRAAFGITQDIGMADASALPEDPSAAWVARGRQLNALILQVLAGGKRILPRPLWRAFMNEIGIAGDPIAPGALSAVSARFAAQNAALAEAHPGLAGGEFCDARTGGDGDWAEADPGRGFRATQYLLAFMSRIDRATRAERKEKAADLARLDGAAKSPAATKKAAPAPAPSDGLSPDGRALLPPLAVEKFETLRGSGFAPHNRLGAVNEEEMAAAFAPMPPRALPQGSTGNVIVGCMKNEAPYILEWVAYHRAIGVDNFLIYTNGCEDGTDEILDRLQDMGILQHRLNDDWKGNSPQQHALNRSLKEPLIRNSAWIIHIDVDEFINVRCGNGTLDDFFAAAPDATNVAMTWRLFGHNGVTRFEDRFVIDQFDTCAPKFCPKPHTVWGFKTMFRNIGAYAKISCHRPNKLAEEFRGKVKWVNGSGRDMTREAADNGWRNSKKSIGYDLLQLNHYALRSAESFLIKRQRGRALHVDRSIGLNYWIRMDWSDYRDITIKRNIPRMQAEYDRLLADDGLREWHDKGLKWHRAKAAELHGMPEFEDLYRQALKVKLTGTERAAYALALDMES
ncbi:MAG: glycosyltransferase family 2 protein [Jhaorihella sp.]